MKTRILLFIIWLAGVFAPTHAADSTAKKPVIPKPISIVSVDNIGRRWHAAKPNLFEIGDYIRIKCSGNLDSVIKANAKDTLILWINNIPFRDNPLWYYNKAENSVIFKLDRKLYNTSAWGFIYNFSYRGFITTHKNKLPVSFGTRSLCFDISEKNVAQRNIDLVVSVRWMMYLFWASAFGCLLILYLAARHTGLLRASLALAPEIKIVNRRTTIDNEIYAGDLPYSLAKVQLAIWFMVVFCSMAYIWATLNEFPVLPDSVALLLAISGGTSVISRIVDRHKEDTADTVTMATFNASYKTRGLWKDLSWDVMSLSLARIQLMAFTIFFAIIFAWNTISTLQLYTFNQAVLLLIGVSSTTYAGMKLKE